MGTCKVSQNGFKGVSSDVYLQIVHWIKLACQPYFHYFAEGLLSQIGIILCHASAPKFSKIRVICSWQCAGSVHRLVDHD